MNFIKLLTTLLVKAYHSEAAKAQKHADKFKAQHRAFEEEADEYRARADEADVAAEDCLVAQIDQLNRRSKLQAKAAEVEKFFSVPE